MFDGGSLDGFGRRRLTECGRYLPVRSTAHTYIYIHMTYMNIIYIEKKFVVPLLSHIPRATTPRPKCKHPKHWVFKKNSELCCAPKILKNLSATKVSLFVPLL